MSLSPQEFERLKQAAIAAEWREYEIAAANKDERKMRVHRRELLLLGETVPENESR